MENSICWVSLALIGLAFGVFFGLRWAIGRLVAAITAYAAHRRSQ